MIDVSAIPAFDDNYIWLLTRAGYGGCAVVDPGDQEPVLDTLNNRGLTLDAILITHKHGDHVGGVRELKQAYPDAVVYGPANEPISGRDRALGEGDSVALPGLGITFTVLDVPGHTEGHIAYLADGLLFCGDTLFAGGCGRVFSGTFDQLSDSLTRLGRLAGDTRVYCAHEYTLDNLGFAKWVEADNPDLQLREDRCRQQRERTQPTVPSTLAEELLTNPFMRTDQAAVIAAAEHWAEQSLPDRAAVFKALRTWKDRAYD